MRGPATSQANRVALALIVWAGGCFSESEPVVDDDADASADTGAVMSTSGGTNPPETTDGASSTGGPGTATITVTGQTASGTSIGGDTGMSTGGDTGGSATITDTAADATGDRPDPLCGFFDDFEAMAFGPLWNVEHPAFVNQTGGEAVIALPELEGQAYPRLEVEPDDGFAGRRAVFRIGQLPPVRGAQLNLYVAQGPTDAVVVSLNYTTELRFEVQQQGGMGGNQTHLDAAYGNPGAGWIQMTENAGMFSVSSSENGLDFKPLVAFSTPFPMDAVRVGIAGSTWDDLPNGPAEVSVGSFEFQCQPALP